MTYKAPLNDYDFIYNHILKLDDLIINKPFDHIDKDMIKDILQQAGKFASEVLEPEYWQSETDGTYVKDKQVVCPQKSKEIYKKFCDSGYNSAGAPVEYSGMGLPSSLYTALFEMFSSANLGFGLCPLLTQGVIHALEFWGNEEQKSIYLPNLISGKWTGTMNLTEPSAGSDVGSVKTKAVKLDDGTYKITGTKIYITFGDHNLSENIIHLVLARLPDAPAGTKGLSMFLVPKYLVNNDGSLAEHNDVYPLSTEEKLGIHSSPTCTMNFGDNGGAIGYLVAQENGGMRAMFTMMNDARLQVGTQGVAVSEIAFQKALSYSKERKQGSKIINSRKENTSEDLTKSVEIIQHQDIQRQLMTIRAKSFASRSIILQTAYYQDKVKTALDDESKKYAQDMLDFMIPVAKGWVTDQSIDHTSRAIQVFGGIGYIEETKIACHYRDARILPIYEGTNGIQAIDFISRKIGKDEMKIFRDITQNIADISSMCLEHGNSDLEIIGDILEFAGDDLLQAGEWMYQKWWLLDQEAEALAGAEPMLELTGLVLGGYLIAKGAYESVVAGDENSQPYVDYARFYMENIISKSKSLCTAATRGMATFGKAQDWNNL